MKILVTGADGQLGKELRYVCQEYPKYEMIFLNRSGLDIVNKDQMETLFSSLKPDICINCAAYTAVDKAESDAQLCHDVNVTGTENLALACRYHNSIFIHVSTDYVYNIDTHQALIESDRTNPKGVYAETKHEGELKALKAWQKSIIIRTSWVYSSFGNNFVKTMLRLGKDRDHLSIVADQIGTPTYARDIARALMKIVSQSTSGEAMNYGIYNFSNSEHTNWADFARTIFDLSAIDCKVSDITTKEYNAAAHRPLWSVLSKEKLNKTFGIKPRPWKDGLIECLSLL